MSALAARLLPWWMLLLVVVVPLAMGGFHDRTKLISGLAGAVLLCLLRLAHGPLGFRHPFSKLVMATLAWVGVLCLPLPFAWVAWLHPAKARLVEDAATGLDATSPTWTTLALDPGASCIEALYGVAILAVFLTSYRLRGQSANAVPVLAVGLAAGLTSLVALAHSLLGQTELYGLYQPAMSLEGRWLISPLLNENHTAALGILGAFAGCALWMRDESTSRTVGAPVILLSVFLVLGSNSRAGIFLAVLGMALLAFALQRQHAHAGLVRTGLKGPGLFLLVGAALWVAIVLEQTQGSLEEGLLSIAPQAWARALDAVTDHLWLGMGPGALGYGTAASFGPSDGSLVTYAHNTWIQLLVDYGVLIVSLSLLTLWSLVQGFRRGPRFDGPELAVTIGLAAVVVQDQLEFPLFMPGVGLAAAAMLGALPWCAPGERSANSPMERTSGLGGEVIWVGAVGLGTVFVLGALASDRPLPRPMDSRAVVSSLEDAEALHSRMLSHPADFVFAQSAAMHAMGWDDRQDTATRFADLALRRAPGDLSANRTRAAIALRSTRPEEAIPFLGVVAAAGPLHLEQATKMLLEARRADLIVPWIESSPLHLGPLVQRLRGRGERELALQLTRWAYEHHGPVSEVLEPFITALAANPENQAELEGLATALLARAGNAPSGSPDRALLREGYLAEGLSLLRQGQPRVAREIFVASAKQDRERSAEPWLKAAEAAYWAKEEGLAMADLARLRRAAVKLPHYRARGDALESRMAEDRGDTSLAIRLLKRASRLVPWDRAFGYLLVSLYERVGDVARADALREKLDAGAP